MPFIEALGQSLYYRLRRSKRAKRLQILFRQNTFEIVAPFKISNHSVIAFLWLNQKWMTQSNQKQQRCDFKITWPADFLGQEMVPFRARTLCLNIKYGESTFTRLQGNTLLVNLSWQKISGEMVENRVREEVKNWYQQQTLKIIQICVTHFCPKLGRWPTGVYLKQQKTRWGSCGIDQKIYLNWLLVLAPSGILEYVVLHELCHLLHPNHGKRFWAKVAENMPDYEIYEKWLNQNGQQLLFLK